MPGTAIARKGPAGIHFGVRWGPARFILALAVRLAPAAARLSRSALPRRQPRAGARGQARQFLPRGSKRCTTCGAQFHPYTILKSASGFLAALPINRISTYREGGTPCVSFQDKDHGMTMERCTMIFCCALSHYRAKKRRRAAVVTAAPGERKRSRSPRAQGVFGVAAGATASGFLASLTFL